MTLPSGWMSVEINIRCCLSLSLALCFIYQRSFFFLFFSLLLITICVYVCLIKMKNKQQARCPTILLFDCFVHVSVSWGDVCITTITGYLTPVGVKVIIMSFFLFLYKPLIPFRSLEYIYIYFLSDWFDYKYKYGFILD
jgi:hypothetical protein